MDKEYYFAYGSNLLDKVISSRRSIKIESWERATLNGYKFVFNCPGLNKYEPAFANIEQQEGHSVHGVVYSLPKVEFDGLVSSEGGMYSVIEFYLNLESGESVKAKSLASKKTIEESTPSLRYLKLLIEGAEEKQLNQEYIEQLKTVKHAPTPPGYEFICKLMAVYLRVRFFLQKRNNQEKTV